MLPEPPSVKAHRLLWSKLTDAQRRTFPRGYIDVTGSRGGKYRIYTKRLVMNIRDRRIFRRARTYCVAPTRYQPGSDMLLSQKLLIEADEDSFREIAVRSFFGW